MNDRRVNSMSPEAKDTLRALRRAAKRALELGLQTGTPVYVWKNNQLWTSRRNRDPRKNRSQSVPSLPVTEPTNVDFEVCHSTMR
jgi:hypothetical protein